MQIIILKLRRALEVLQREQTFALWTIRKYTDTKKLDRS